MTAFSNTSAFIESLQQSWQQQDWGRLAEMYHANAVLLPPDLGASLIGRDAILETYRDFAAQATLHRFEVIDIKVHDFNHCQVVHCAFEADYSLTDARSLDTGTDIYVLEQGVSGEPLIVWRQQIIQSVRTLD